jgi:K+-transporting ATPase KdpF subunit
MRLSAFLDAFLTRLQAFLPPSLHPFLYHNFIEYSASQVIRSREAMGGIFGMKAVLIVSGLIGLGLLAYLFYVLFRGESL